AERGLVVAGSLDAEVPRLRLRDEHGPLDVYALPFVELERVRALFPDADIPDSEAATRWMLDRIRAGAEEGVRKVLVGHAFVAGGLVAESERPLSVGGAGTVDAGLFDGFDFVALGHLHRRQGIGERIRYAGSLYKYSFSEAAHTKSVDLVTIGAAGELPDVRSIPFALRRDLRRLDGTMDELVGTAGAEGRDDYISVMLRDPGIVYDAIGKLRAVYPNVLHIERPQAQAGAAAAPNQDRRRMAHEALFRQFFADVTGEALTDAQARALDEVLESIRRAGREVAE
ncbi:MAG TPA: exonuclease SbcCD subunit D C-terminal domain-containing protein, partial [Myxococcota bacterium]|nr:exonuclease SbcCD subunit D C-terminal domain-containing protein [Myxococcota bacterium]